MWDPDKYLDFSDERARPFHELTARIRVESPRRVVDLGCGPGNLTATLAARWPGATVEAIDSSPEMVAAARAAGIEARVAAVQEWVPPRDTDVVVTNAVLQWVPEHRKLLVDWLAAMPSRAWLAMQVPGNFGEPSHRLVRDLARETEWAHTLRDVVLREDEAVDGPVDYAELIASAGCEVDAWETTYIQRLTGPDAVLEWITGTALRPVKVALDAQQWRRFRDALAPRLREAYPARPDGTTWFPFRRVFAVGRTP